MRRVLSRLYQFQWEVSRNDTAPTRWIRVTRFTDHLFKIAVSRLFVFEGVVGGAYRVV